MKNEDNPWTSDESTTLAVYTILHLCPDVPDSMAYDLMQNWTVRLQIRFATPVSHTVSAIV